METKNFLSNNNSENLSHSENIDKEKIEAAAYELIDMFRQIWAINNTLNLLYEVLEVREEEIANPASSMEVCMQQLAYIHKHSFEVLDTILEASGLNKYFGC